MKKAKKSPSKKLPLTVATIDWMEFDRKEAQNLSRNIVKYCDDFKLKNYAIDMAARMRKNNKLENDMWHWLLCIREAYLTGAKDCAAYYGTKKLPRKGIPA